MNVENQTDTADMMHLSDSRDCDADGDCVRSLGKVKACDVALIKQMKLSE